MLPFSWSFLSKFPGTFFDRFFLFKKLPHKRNVDTNNEHPFLKFTLFVRFNFNRNWLQAEEKLYAFRAFYVASVNSLSVI